MRSIFKSLVTTGALDFPLLGNDVSVPHAAYAHPLITSVLKANAARHKGSAYGFSDDITFEGLKQYIHDRPVILLMRLGSEFWTAPDGRTSWAEKDILPLRAPKARVSGHFVVAHYYDEDCTTPLICSARPGAAKATATSAAAICPTSFKAGALLDLSFNKNLSQA
jgi:hypothetical protein